MRKQLFMCFVRWAPPMVASVANENSVVWKQLSAAVTRKCAKGTAGTELLPLTLTSIQSVEYNVHRLGGPRSSVGGSFFKCTGLGIFTYLQTEPIEAIGVGRLICDCVQLLDSR